RRAEPENVRMDCPENGNSRTRQPNVCRTCLRPRRFENEPETHRGDSKRNRADPPLNQIGPPLLSTSPYNGNARPPTRAEDNTPIAARIVRSTGRRVPPLP